MPNRQRLHETLPIPPRHLSQYGYIVFGIKAFRDHGGPPSLYRVCGLANVPPDIHVSIASIHSCIAAAV
ncbi:hypothetical protein BOTNAR_0019g00370 [Botryotinia narcissicola]|uniref:Uncharacterized protein n=1 Tax=Botryotinia narcissicola TaxID=278944 RepID=A0A4Z1J5G5_9HELO|nr:hypothetical protein BOTNAR_0019g00370 [Botryotinia narcissicola]